MAAEFETSTRDLSDVRYSIERARLEPLVDGRRDMFVVGGWVETKDFDRAFRLQIRQSGDVLAETEAKIERADIVATFNSSNGSCGCESLTCGFAFTALLKDDQPVKLFAKSKDQEKKIMHWSVPKLRVNRQPSPVVRCVRMVSEQWKTYLYEFFVNKRKDSSLLQDGDEFPKRRLDSDRPVRALIVGHNLNFEGAPRVLYEIAVGLKRRGRVEPTILSPFDGPQRACFDEAGIPTVIAELPNCPTINGWPSKRDYEESLPIVKDVLSRERPDVVVANTIRTFFFINVAAELGIPTVWHIHECYSTDNLLHEFQRYLRSDCRSAFRHADQIVYCSRTAREIHRNLDRWQNSTVVHNRIDVTDINEFLGSTTIEEARSRIGAPQGRKVIVTAGTVCERKSQHVLVEAAARLKQHRDDFCCYLVGLREEVEPVYVAQLRGLITAHQLHDVVKLIPETERVFDYYRAADVFAFCSKTETFGLVVAEAKAFGLPIVTTPCGGVSEQVRDDVHALFFPMLDSRALAAQLERLLDNEKQRTVMGRISREQTAHLTTHENMLAKFEQLVLSSRLSNRK